MNKMIVTMLGVWAVAFGSTAGLAYTLSRPPQPVGTIDEVLGVPAPAPPVEAVVPKVARPIEPYVAMPAVTIVARAPMAPAPRPPRALSEMSCSNWRELVMGPANQRVRYCE